MFRYCSSATRTSWLRVRTPVFLNSCCIEFLTALSDISILAAISLLAKPCTTCRSTPVSLSPSAGASRYSTAAGMPSASSSAASAMIAANLGVNPSLYVENQTLAVKDSPLPRSRTANYPALCASGAPIKRLAGSLSHCQPMASRHLGPPAG